MSEPRISTTENDALLPEVDKVMIGPVMQDGRLQDMRQCQMWYKNGRITQYDCVFVEVERPAKNTDPLAIRLVLGTAREVRKSGT